MAKVCLVCGKKPSVGHTVSHSNRKTKRRFNPNLQRLSFTLQGKDRRGYVCTTCIKSGRITKTI